jgi:excinuclease ABC subunit A
MQVDRYKIHDIELVIDRLQVADDLKARLSQSVQQTLKLGKDLMFLLINDEKNIVQYSKQLMCEDTGISYEEPSPNSFSFNSPYGACPVCKGLGIKHHINMDAVIVDLSLNISEGGIVPLGEERDAWVYRQAQEAAKKNKISLKTPINKLSKKQINIMLYGNEEGQQDDIDFENMKFDPAAPFEGIVIMLQRWFANPYSEAIRDWSEGYMILKPCDACSGKRLKKESLWFKIDGKNIAELS